VWDFILSNPQLLEHTSEAALKVAAATTGLIEQATLEGEAWRRMSAAFGEELPVLGEPPVVTDKETFEARQALEAKVVEMRRQRSNAVVWGGFWLWHFPGSFGKSWGGWRGSNPRAAEEFMFALAAHVGDDRVGLLKQVAVSGGDGLKTLKMLYEWVCSVVREDDDPKREDRRLHAVGARDRAKRLRDALVPAIAHAKSQQAYDILDELRLKATGPRTKYLRHLQFMMREEQAAKKPLPQRDYAKFETDFAPPVSDYISFAMAVHNDLLAIKYQIEHGEFSLRRFFNSLNFSRIKTASDGLGLEEDFQALLGSELSHAAANRYAVTLESMLPESTRRDVLCQSGSFRATVELKMSVRWTLEDCLESLDQQLRGQYMQSRDSKIGFFVVVLQKARTWDAPDGSRIEFPALLEILAKRARELEAKDTTLFMRVIGIDATPKEDFRAARPAKQAQRKGTIKYADGTGKTWSGLGKRPKWVRDALASGKSLDDILASQAGGTHNQKVI